MPENRPQNYLGRVVRYHLQSARKFGRDPYLGVVVNPAEIWFGGYWPARRPDFEAWQANERRLMAGWVRQWDELNRYGLVDAYFIEKHLDVTERRPR